MIKKELESSVYLDVQHKDKWHPHKCKMKIE